MNKAQATQIHQELNAAVKAVLAAHGLDSKTKMTWSTSGEVKFNVTAKTEEAANDNVKLFAKVECGIDYNGEQFTLAGKKLTLVDYNRRARTYPFVAEGTNGKRYKLSAEQVSNALK